MLNLVKPVCEQQHVANIWRAGAASISLMISIVFVYEYKTQLFIYTRMCNNTKYTMHKFIYIQNKQLLCEDVK